MRARSTLQRVLHRDLSSGLGVLVARRLCAATQHAEEALEEKKHEEAWRDAEDRKWLDVTPNERAEHETFMSYCRDTCKVTARGVAIRSTCSASHWIRKSEGPANVIKAKGAFDRAAAAAEAKGEELPQGAMQHPSDDEYLQAASEYDFRHGRGMIATEELPAGFAFLRAPLNRIALSVEALENMHGEHNRYQQNDAMAAAFKAMPDAKTIATIVEDMMVRDQFYQHVFSLATWLAWERLDLESPATPFLNTLPVPAIDDEVILTVHANGMDSVQSREYFEFSQDFIYGLKRIRSSWQERVNRLSIDNDLKQRAQARVPPIQVLDWAWRTAMGRQVPVPPLGIAPGMECFRGSTTKSVNFTQWFELHGEQGALLPALVPLFDLVDHQRVANAELDVLMRPLRDDGTVDFEVVDEYAALLAESEVLNSRRVKTSLSNHAPKKYGFEYFMNKINDAKLYADKIQRTVVGETGGTAAEDGDPLGLQAQLVNMDTEARKKEKANRRKEISERISELETHSGSRLTPVVELRTTQPIKPGDAIGMHYALLHSRSFTLYRFGFEPV